MIFLKNEQLGILIYSALYIIVNVRTNICKDHINFVPAVQTISVHWVELGLPLLVLFTAPPTKFEVN